jgi:hypothetical protein
MRQLVVSSPDDSRAIISFEKQIRFDYRPVKRAEIPSTPQSYKERTIAYRYV